MEIDKSKIGHRYTRKAANGMQITVVIANDPKQFDLYRLLGLDVFSPSISKKLKPIDLNAMKMSELREYAKKFGVTGRSKQAIIDELEKKHG